MSCMAYERIMRDAFSMILDKGINAGRDPAGLARAAAYENRDLDAVKIGTGYAMSIFQHVLSKSWGMDNEKEMKRMKSLISAVIAATSVDDVGRLIAQFQKTVIDEYFVIEETILREK